MCKQAKERKDVPQKKSGPRRPKVFRIIWRLQRLQHLERVRGGDGVETSVGCQAPRLLVSRANTWDLSGFSGLLGNEQRESVKSLEEFGAVEPRPKT